MSYNLTFIIFYARILSYRILERNGNQETFRQFLHQIHDDADAAGLAGPTLVMDNVGFHKTEIVREELIILELLVKYLPAYSPFFNPIKKMFSKWKNFAEAQAKNEVELLAAMNGVRTVITAEDCNNYVTRVNTNCNNCAHHNVDYFDN